MKFKLMKTLSFLGVMAFQSHAFGAVSPEMGRGIQTFDREEIVRDRCVVINDGDVVTSKAMETKYSLNLINNKEELFDKIEMTSKNSGSYGSFNAKAKVHFVKQVKWNYNSTYILVRAERVTSTQTLNADNILLNNNAKNILLDSRVKFLESCGNRFINKVNYGGEIYGLLEIQSRTYQEKQTLELSLSAGGSIGGAKGSSKTDYKREIERLTSKYQAKVSFRHVGGEQIKAPNDAATLIDLSNRIEEITDSNPVPVSIETRDYFSVSNYLLDNDSYETKIRQDEIDWAEGKLKQARNLYAQSLYALENPKDFKDLDEAELKKNLTYLDDKIMELKNFISRASSFVNKVDHNDISIDLDNINIPEQKRKASKKELKVTCVKKESSLCGISSYKKQKSSSCGIKGVNTGTGPACGAVYNQKASEFCGVKSYNLQAGKVCGALRYKQCHHRSCGKKTFGGNKRCRASACGVEVYKSCRDVSFGAEEFNSCRHEKHGIEGYLTCADKDFGYDFDTCSHLSHGPESYNICEVAKIGTQESYCPEF